MCTLCKQLDASRIDAFAGKLLGVLNNGALALLLSIGHRTRLFDTMQDLPPSDSAQIAKAAGLNERYVREWLAGLLTAEIVGYDPETKTWWLPREHAALLTRSASPNNIGAFMQYIATLGAVEDRIVDCFQKGGGVPYSEFKRFHEVMAEDSGQTVVSALFDHIVPLVPGLHDKLQKGADVLDLGCGRGIALRMLASRYPKSRFLGIDFSEEAITWARGQAAADRLENLRYDVVNAPEFRERAAYDVIFTFDAIHDQARPDIVLKNIAEALRPDGVYLMQDIHASSLPHENVSHPAGTLLYTVSTMHCMTVSLAQPGGMGLGTMWGRQLAEKMLHEAGFGRVEVRRLAHDFQNDYYIVRHGSH